MISVICTYNDRKILEDNLLKILNKQSADFELILLDDTNERFSSCADALNYGAKKAKGDYLMFAHQDVDLLTDTWLDNVEKILCSLDNLGVAGLAGFANIEGKPVMVSNIKDGNPPEPAGIPLKTSAKVQTVDECLFFIPRSVFSELQFDSVTCSNWHLYAVDYCLTIQKRGLSVYVINPEVYHASRSSSFSEDYYSTLKKVIKKHRINFDKIYTTCGVWNTNRVRLLINISEDKILRKFHLR